jgi:hypothetical protein
MAIPYLQTTSAGRRLQALIDWLTAGADPIAVRTSFGASGLAPVVATLNAVAQSNPFTPATGRPFNVTHRRSNDFAGSYQLERQFTGDANWYIVLGYADLVDLPETFALTESEAGVTYRWNLTARTAGSVAVRI